MTEYTLVAKVLVIDDEIGPRESMRILLKNDCDVTCCSSVDEGVKALRDGMLPDLIVMDIRMPRKSGIEGLREIRAIDPLVSVVMLTGYGSLETAQEALRLGANDYVNKPFDTRKMQAIVRRYAERTRVERKRSGLLRELSEMNTSLVNSLADKDRLASVGQRSSELIHDLRNPLAIVSGYVNLLTEEIRGTKAMPGAESVSEYLDVIEQNVQRCCELSKMWQRYAKDDSMNFVSVPLDKVLDELKSGISLLGSTMDVQVVWDVAAMDAEVHGSAAQLIRAIHNIGVNALQATQPHRGKVRFSCRRYGNESRIRIEDNGCGMAPKTLAKIFDPYFTTKVETSGTGLGMGIAKKIIEDHGGRLEVESQEGKGTVMTLFLPLKDDSTA